jgi:hypothetical protein
MNDPKSFLKVDEFLSNDQPYNFTRPKEEDDYK